MAKHVGAAAGARNGNAHELVNAVIAVWGGNRANMLARCASIIFGDLNAAAKEWRGPECEAPQGNIRVASGRSFGSIGYAMLHFRAPRSFVSAITDSTFSKRLQFDLANNCDPLGDISTFRVKVNRALPLEADHHRFQKFNFRLISEGPAPAIEQATKAVAECGLNVVIHDAIMLPQPGPYQDGPSKYYQYFRCVSDLETKQGKKTSWDRIEHALQSNGIGLDNQHYQREPTKTLSIDAGAKPGKVEDFHDGPFLYCSFAGLDSKRMASHVAALFASLQRGWEERRNNNMATASNARHGVLASSARSVGGHGIVQACIAVPREWAERWQDDLQAHIESHIERRLESFHELLNERNKKGKRQRRLDVSLSRFSPWHSREQGSAISCVARCPDQPGVIARFAHEITKPGVNRVDISSLEVELRAMPDFDILDQPQRTEMSCELILPRDYEVEPREHRASVQAYIRATAEQQGLTLNWIA